MPREKFLQMAAQTCWQFGCIMSLKNVIIDTDSGIDDILAMMLAFNSSELKIEAVTTVAGVVAQEQAQKRALRLLKFLDVKNVPVATGAVKPLLREFRETFETTDLDELLPPESEQKLDRKPAARLILDKADELNGDLTIIAIGPLTNIAVATLVDPEIVDKITELIIMGGAFNITPYGRGNVTPVAEFNMWCDPEAAKIVFDSGITVKAIGLDVTTDPDNRLSNERFKEIWKSDTKRARLVVDLCRRHIQELGYFNLHDPIAVAAAIDPELIRTKRLFVEIETISQLTYGQTIVHELSPSSSCGKRSNIEVCVSVDSERFIDLFISRMVS